MAGVKIVTADLLKPTAQALSGQLVPTNINPAVAQATGQMDGFIQILTRIERIINSPTIKPIFAKALDKWEKTNETGGQQVEQKYNNPQVWDAPVKTKAPAVAKAPVKTETTITQTPVVAQFTEEQMRKYFPTADDVIIFIEELLKILPEEMTTKEVAQFVASYVGQLPEQPIKIIKPLFSAGKPLMKQQLMPMYANTGVKGAEKGGKKHAKNK